MTSMQTNNKDLLRRTLKNVKKFEMHIKSKNDILF